jgi:hypothetical protein
LQKEPVGDFELSLTKASVVRKTIVGDASVGAIGDALLGDATAGLPLDEARIEARALIAADAPAVRDAFAAYIHPQKFVHVVEGP